MSKMTEQLELLKIYTVTTKMGDNNKSLSFHVLGADIAEVGRVADACVQDFAWPDVDDIRDYGIEVYSLRKS
jgi:hypothetical protein